MSHDPIHDWLDKILGGSSKDERKRDERRLQKLKEKAERQGQQVMYGRGGAFIPMQQTYDPQGMPIAPGLQIQPSIPASSGIGSGIPSQHSQMPPLHPRFSTRWSHATALVQSQELRNSHLQQGSLLPSHQNYPQPSGMLLHARNSPSMVSVSTSPLATHPSSSYSTRSPLAPSSASKSQYSSESDSSETTRHNHGSTHRSPMHVAQSAPNVSGSQSNRPRSSSIHQENPQLSHRHNVGQSSLGSYPSSVQPSRPSLLVSQSVPVVPKSHGLRQQSTRGSLLGSREYSSSSESLAEPSAYSMSIATSKAQVGDMQRTYYEGMVPMTPSEFRAGQEEKGRREQEWAKPNGRKAQNSGQNSRK
ncbi:hypothetical protein DL95DRAFT_405531 [Leptodontidium sp. 2 PMI_412]|nr:hypothetical protein DL95DRAFT_405531 [Leptodontidium sp. 2 PMI_412]